MTMMRPGFGSLLGSGMKKPQDMKPKGGTGWKGMAAKRPGAMKSPAMPSAIRTGGSSPLGLGGALKKKIY